MTMKENSKSLPQKKEPPRFIPLQVSASRGGIAVLCEQLNTFAEKGYGLRNLFLAEGSFLAVLERGLVKPPETYNSFYEG